MGLNQEGHDEDRINRADFNIIKCGKYLPALAKTDFCTPLVIRSRGGPFPDAVNGILGCLPDLLATVSV